MDRISSPNGRGIQFGEFAFFAPTLKWAFGLW
jgi:hypothetical protein